MSEEHASKGHVEHDVWGGMLDGTAVGLVLGAMQGLFTVNHSHLIPTVLITATCTVFAGMVLGAVWGARRVAH